MRPAVGGIVAVGAFAGVLILGGNALGVWDPVPPSTPIVVEGPHAREARFRPPRPTGKPTAKSVARSEQNRREPRERLRRSDNAIARAAVLRQSDMNGDGWKRIHPSPDVPQHCASHDPDLSRFTLTGKARSAFKGSASYIESRATLLPSALEAQRYFEANFGPRALGCLRNSVKRALAKAGLQPRLLGARYEGAPNVGDQTSAYVIEYAITAHRKRFRYPVDIIAFRTSRAVGSLWFALIPSSDGQRPCTCEFYEARKVEARLGKA
jgi:hypothetical protein